MTPKEKAFNLIKMFNPHTEEHRIPIYHSKQCALITVNEIIYVAQYECHAPRGYNPHETVEYWEEVKQEIENL